MLVMCNEKRPQKNNGLAATSIIKNIACYTTQDTKVVSN